MLILIIKKKCNGCKKECTAQRMSGESRNNVNKICIWKTQKIKKLNIGILKIIVYVYLLPVK